MAVDCVFCKIVDGEIPNFTVYEDEDVLAFLNINPVVEGHALVIPKGHTEVLPALRAGDRDAVFSAVQHVDQRLRDVIGCDDVSVLIRDGPAAGQEVPHLHVHLIPRFRGDGLGPGYVEGPQADMKVLSALSEKLRAE